MCGADENSVIWEVGPGIGALTTRLLQTGAKVTAFEIDHGFCRILREKAYTDVPNFRLIEGDALKTWKEVYEKEGAPDMICANLPYNVGSVFIASVIENRCLPSRMVYTLQSEVVDRICAKMDDEQYSGFSILTGIDYENREALKIKSGCFFPSPNVDSSVVVMQRRNSSLVPEKDRNNLKALGLASEKIDSALDKSGILPSERAEKLSTDQILTLLRNLDR